MYAFVRAFVRASACACVCVNARACMYACVCVLVSLCVCLCANRKTREITPEWITLRVFPSEHGIYTHTQARAHTQANTQVHTHAYILRCWRLLSLAAHIEPASVPNWSWAHNRCSAQALQCPPAAYYQKHRCSRIGARSNKCGCSQL